MRANPKDYRVPPGEKVCLEKWPTRGKPLCKTPERYRQRLHDNAEALQGFQELLYANDGYSLLLIFQAMDAAGKDGVIKHVLSGVNPQGFQVYSFKHPSDEDLDHDFLWRSVGRLPERGRIGVFNRSYYEEVLIVRVHPEILRAERIPDDSVPGKTVWEHRYHSILEFEKHLHRSGTRILKFFLHLSKEEQRRRFLKRIETPDKNWKFSRADVEERAYWDDYQKAYAACLGATSTRHAPWHIVPADDKDDARLIVSDTLLETLRGLKMTHPKQTPERLKELKAARRLLLKEGD